MIHKIACIQNYVFPTLKQTLYELEKDIQLAVQQKPILVVLPECFNTYYNLDIMKINSEQFENSTTIDFLKTQTKLHQIYLIGSLPIKKLDKYYNRAILVNPQGYVQDYYEKAHLFDIDIKNQITYKESGIKHYQDLFTQGEQLKVFSLLNLTIGIGICYDLRFPELSLYFHQKNVDLLLYPGAFNQITGPLHWSILLQARAIDTQCYVCGVATARSNDKNAYQSWGHSKIIDSNGQIIQQLEQQRGIIYADVDINKNKQIRQAIPTGIQKRNDLYKIDFIE